MVVDLPNVVSVDDNTNLVKPVENQEIKEAVLQKDKFKAPNPDGFGAAFFQDYWHIVQDAVYQAIRSFFRTGVL